jgi:hypothetical protein
LAASLAMGALAGGCSTRERTNPLDPLNHQTSGSIPGFDAFATNGAVELTWSPLPLQGVRGYRVLRWKPGERPAPLDSTDLSSGARFTEDRDVQNESTYVYRLVAHLTDGDSAFSRPDTATPGTRRIVALGGGSSALAGFSPDGRDLSYSRESSEPYQDMELDRRRGILWLTLNGAGQVERRTLEGLLIGEILSVEGPTDVSVSPGRGYGWATSPSTGVVHRYGPDLNDLTQDLPIAGVGHPRVVEAGVTDASAWVGNDEGQVSRFRASDAVFQERWILGAPIRAIALDEATVSAWVATRSGATCDLYYLTAGDTTRTLVRSALSNVVDLAADPGTRSLWVSERGTPGSGQGRLSRLSQTGQTLASVSGLEPYGIDVDPLDGSCWVSDLVSGRLLRVNPDGAIRSRSIPIAVPYAVRVQAP